jgi:REP element-mobilizing transposase RayT
MPTPRRLQVSVEATPYYHCISRCVRRAYLCGEDRVTRQRFDHRKGWLVDRMKELTTVFAIDLCAYAVLSNHFHIVVRVDREQARRWSAEEVVARYGRCFPHRVEDWATLPEAERIRRVEQWRERLWDLSWFMRALNEAIARRANREDGCTGRFWEGRFRSQALLDDGAVLTCMSYVDLNPMRAGIAPTLELSDYTSIQERVLALGPGSGGIAHSRLVPFGEDVTAAPTQTMGRLPMALRDYVNLLESTGRSIRRKPPGDTLPAQVEMALRRLGLDPAGFVASVREFRRGFFGMVGEVHRIDLESRRRGYARRLGLRAARRLYQPAAA